jgi:hypothetical protein
MYAFPLLPYAMLCKLLSLDMYLNQKSVVCGREVRLTTDRSAAVRVSVCTRTGRAVGIRR